LLLRAAAQDENEVAHDEIGRDAAAIIFGTGLGASVALENCQAGFIDRLDDSRSRPGRRLSDETGVRQANQGTSQRGEEARHFTGSHGDLSEKVSEGVSRSSYIRDRGEAARGAVLGTIQSRTGEPNQVQHIGGIGGKEIPRWETVVVDTPDMNSLS
jgi:hypothetical protein